MTLDINEGAPVDLCGEPGVDTLPDPSVTVISLRGCWIKNEMFLSLPETGASTLKQTRNMACLIISNVWNGILPTKMMDYWRITGENRTFPSNNLTVTLLSDLTDISPLSPNPSPNKFVTSVSHPNGANQKKRNTKKTNLVSFFRKVFPVPICASLSFSPSGEKTRWGFTVGFGFCAAAGV